MHMSKVRRKVYVSYKEEILSALFSGSSGFLYSLVVFLSALSVYGVSVFPNVMPGTGEMEFVGFKNYKMIFKDPNFGRA